MAAVSLMVKRRFPVLKANAWIGVDISSRRLVLRKNEIVVGLTTTDLQASAAQKRTILVVSSLLRRKHRPLFCARRHLRDGRDERNLFCRRIPSMESPNMSAGLDRAADRVEKPFPRIDLPSKRRVARPDAPKRERIDDVTFAERSQTLDRDPRTLASGESLERLDDKPSALATAARRRMLACRGVESTADNDTILVLDRDVQASNRIGEALVPRGFRISEFQSAEDAVSFAAKRQPVAVFADLVLASEWQGKFFRWFRSFLPMVPIVVTVTPSESSDAQANKRLGVKQRLKKPFDVADVYETLSQALREDDSGNKQAMVAISARLRATRRRLGLKQSLVALRTGLSIAQISQIESRSSTPSLPSLLRICRALRIPLSEIVAGV